MKTYVKDLRIIFQSIFYRWRILLAFEFLYRVIGSLLIYPMVNFLIQKTLDFAKLAYLDLNHIQIWLTSPYTFPLLFLCFLILGSYILYEMSVLSYYFHWSLKQGAFNLQSLIKTAFHKILKIIKPINWLMLIMIMVLFPLTSLSLTPASLIRFRIPEYMIDFIHEQGSFFYSCYICIILIINLLVFHMLYIVPSFLLNDMNFRPAWQNSRKLLKKKLFKNPLVLYSMFDRYFCMLPVSLWRYPIDFIYLLLLSARYRVILNQLHSKLYVAKTIWNISLPYRYLHH